jgi:hypothetical protein
VVEYQWKKSGKYKNIKDIVKLDANLIEKSWKNNGQIARMSSLKSAIELLANTHFEPEKKKKLAISWARDFEKYITEPEDKSYTELDREQESKEDFLNTEENNGNPIIQESEKARK